MADEEVEGQQQSGRSPVRLITWAFVLVTFLVIIGIFAKFFFLPSNEMIEQPSAQEQMGPGEYVSLGTTGEFVSNLAPPDDDAFISVNILAELDAERESKESMAIKEEIMALDEYLQQEIQRVLQSRTRNDLNTPEGQDGMSKEILRKVNTQLTKGKVRRIIVNNLLIQAS